MLTLGPNSLFSSSLVPWWKTERSTYSVLHLGFSGVTIWILRLNALAKLVPFLQSLSCFQEEPKRVCFTYDLFLNLEGNPPVNHLRCEKLTFNNPTKEFRRKLIRAGGVSAGTWGGSAPACAHLLLLWLAIILPTAFHISLKDHPAPFYSWLHEAELNRCLCDWWCFIFNWNVTINIKNPSGKGSCVDIVCCPSVTVFCSLPVCSLLIFAAGKLNTQHFLINKYTWGHLPVA